MYLPYSQENEIAIESAFKTIFKRNQYVINRVRRWRKEENYSASDWLWVEFVEK